MLRCDRGPYRRTRGPGKGYQRELIGRFDMAAMEEDMHEWNCAQAWWDMCPWKLALSRIRQSISRERRSVERRPSVAGIDEPCRTTSLCL